MSYSTVKRRLGIVVPTEWAGFESLDSRAREVLKEYPAWELARNHKSFRLELSDLANIKLDAILIADSGKKEVLPHSIKKIPTINLSNSVMQSKRFPRISMDEIAAGRMVAEHFRDQGLSSFIYLGWSKAAFSRLRKKGFEQGCEPFSVHSFEVDSWYKDQRENSIYAEDIHRWNLMLARTLCSCKRPLGIFAADNLLGIGVLKALSQMPWTVPHEVAVAAVNNSPGAFPSSPQLTTVTLPCRSIVKKALEAFDAFLTEGKPIQDLSFSIEPEALLIRESSARIPVTDDPLVRALNVIHQSFRDNVTVDELARRAGISRRKLEYHFSRRLGYGPYRELLRIRAMEAKRLLVDTEMDMEHIAEWSGYTSAQQMGLYFRRAFKYSPRDYRKSKRDAHLAEES